MSRSPYGRNDVCDALNGCVCKSGQDVGEVIADRDLEPSTTFHTREDGGYARPSLFAADVDPVGAANCDRARMEFSARLVHSSNSGASVLQNGFNPVE
jgi:hypothetical protein